MMRTQYEGALNVLRFNWPRYAFGVFVVLVTATDCLRASGVLSVAFAVFASLALLALLLPFIATHYIYDRSSLYAMPWLKSFDTERPEVLLNITAGFDESSALLHERFPGSNLQVVDFFDPQLHTEPSIARARNAYPPFPGTRYMRNGALPVDPGSVDLVIAFLSLHEVRDHGERVAVLNALRRSVRPAGRVIVTEHLRDLPNLLVFTIGVFHFHSHRTWLRAFTDAGFVVEAEQRTTPFITTFILGPA